jgi:hypothetical protein
VYELAALLLLLLCGATNIPWVSIEGGFLYHDLEAQPQSPWGGGRGDGGWGYIPFDLRMELAILFQLHNTL